MSSFHFENCFIWAAGVQRPHVIILFDLIMLAGISVDDPPIEETRTFFNPQSRAFIPGVINWILEEWMECCDAVDSTSGRDQVDKKLWIVLIIDLDRRCLSSSRDGA